MRFPNRSFLAVLLLSAVPLAAQIPVPGPGSLPAPIPALSQTLTTGIVGFTGSQTAVLNVLNMSAATTATAAGCEVQLAFYDSQNRLLKQGATAMIAPGVATSLSLGRADVPAASATTPRVSIRGQVKTVVPSPGTAAGPAILVGICSLFTSLDVYDNVTGVTQVFTTDARTVFIGDVLPLTAIQPAGR
jgi:hypothetical protein